MLKHLFGSPEIQKPHWDSVYAGIVALARQPWLYSRAGVPDTVDGRFDMIVLHLAMLLERLHDGGPAAAALSQGVLDTMFADMDRSLREMGVGDLSVAKRMRTMAEAYFGRVLAYREALAADNPAASLTNVLERNLFPAGVAQGANMALLAAHALAFRQALGAMAVEALAGGKLPQSAPGDGREVSR